MIEWWTRAHSGLYRCWRNGTLQRDGLLFSLLLWACWCWGWFGVWPDARSRSLIGKCNSAALWWSADRTTGKFDAGYFHLSFFLLFFWARVADPGCRGFKICTCHCARDTNLEVWRFHCTLHRFKTFCAGFSKAAPEHNAASSMFHSRDRVLLLVCFTGYLLQQLWTRWLPHSSQERVTFRDFFAPEGSC